MRLWYPKDPENASALKILATANYLNLPLETEVLDGAKNGWTNNSEDFREHYDPTGQYPVLELTDPEIITANINNNNQNNNTASPRPSTMDTNRSSTSLQTARRRPTNLLLNGEASKSNHVFGANAILRFVGRSAGDETNLVVSENNTTTTNNGDDGNQKENVDFLNHQDEKYIYGRTPFEASQVDMWISFSENEIDAANHAFIAAHFLQNDKGGLSVPNAAEEYKKVEHVMAALDEVLLIRTFLVGERLTLADIAVAFSVQLVYRCNKKYSEDVAKKYRQVYRHYNSVMRHPKIKEVMRQAGATLGPLR